jgi:hypothetical protein
MIFLMMNPIIWSKASAKLREGQGGVKDFGFGPEGRSPAHGAGRFITRTRCPEKECLSIG